MQRVFREAKFCIEADDEEISDSPIVANLFCRLMDALIETEVLQDGELARSRWEKWLEMTNVERDECRAVRRRINKNANWEKWTEDRKIEHLRVLFSPFIISDDFARHFLADI